MGKRGGGWGRGGGGEREGRGGPRGVRPCPAQPGVQSRAQKDPTHGPEPCDWASPLAPRGHPVPTSPIPLTSCLSSLLPPRAWDSRALAPNRDWATEEPASHLGGGWPGPRGPSLQPTPPPTSSRPSLGPRGWAFGKSLPRGPPGSAGGGRDHGAVLRPLPSALSAGRGPSCLAQPRSSERGLGPLLLSEPTGTRLLCSQSWSTEGTARSPRSG